MTTLISTLFLTFLVLAVVAMFLGGLCSMCCKWKYCTRCQMFWNECGNRTTEPPDRLDVRPEWCQECTEERTAMKMMELLNQPGDWRRWHGIALGWLVIALLVLVIILGRAL